MRMSDLPSPTEKTVLAPRRQLFAWAMFDFANSGYTTVVLTAVFSAYFVNTVASSATNGVATFYWTLVMACANLIVLVTAPVLGAIADFSGYKKRFLLGTTIGCVVFTALLSLVGPGDLWLGFAIVMIATIMFSSGENFIAAFLPEISPPEHMGRVSGYGWALGYIGGLLVLGLCLWYVIISEQQGIPAHRYVPVTMLITAVSFAMASVPTFLWLPERRLPHPARESVDYLRTGFRRVRDTLREGKRFSDLWRALIAMTIYHCGIYTVILLAAVYASTVMGFSTRDTIAMILVVNITAAAGAFVFGQVQDRIGSVKSLIAILLVWCIALVIVVAEESRSGFWVAANLIGLSMGASQAGGRALVGQFSPVERSAEFFGLWGLAVKLAAIIGPMAYGSIAVLSRGNHQLALLFTIGFFVAGLVILSTVNEHRGRAAVHQV